MADESRSAFSLRLEQAFDLCKLVGAHRQRVAALRECMHAAERIGAVVGADSRQSQSKRSGAGGDGSSVCRYDFA